MSPWVEYIRSILAKGRINMYPISAFVKKHMKKKGLSREELASRMGYQNITKGVEKIDLLIEEGSYNRFIYLNLATALDVNPLVARKLFKLTDKLKRNSERERLRAGFTPHLLVLNENESPAKSSLVEIFGYERLKKIKLPPNIVTLSTEEQLKLIRETIRKHFKELAGKTAFFGKITGYKYMKDFEEPEYSRLYFNTQGHIAVKELTLYSASEIAV